jgi:hypothetical protein
VNVTSWAYETIMLQGHAPANLENDDRDVLRAVCAHLFVIPAAHFLSRSYVCRSKLQRNDSTTLEMMLHVEVELQVRAF